MKKNYRLSFSSIFFLLTIFSAFAQQQYTNGIFVLNEMGNAGTATVSFLPNGGTIQHDIFGTVNPTAGGLGSTGQSMSFFGDNAYIILNMSNRLRVVNKTTFQLVETLNTGLENPRYMAFSNGKGYITCWGDPELGTDDYIAVLNLQTNMIETTIAVAEGVERIMEINGKLYATHKGGYGYGNQVSVINPIDNTLETTIAVGDVPNTMVVDGDFLYVLCEGNPGWVEAETFGELTKINLATNTVTSTLNFPTLHPTNLKLDNGYFFYSDFEKVYKMPVNATQLPTTPLVTLPAPQPYGMYGMDIIDGELYLVDSALFLAASKVYVHDLNGAPLFNFVAQTGVNGFYKADENLGTGNHQKSEVSLYPNPTTNVFYINTNEIASVIMYDLSGRVVIAQNYTASGINVGHLSKGIYVVETQIGSNKSIQKLIVK